MLMYEFYTGRFFMAKDEDVEATKQELVEQLAVNGYLYLDDVYDAIAKLAEKSGLPPLRGLGWLTDREHVDEPILDFTECCSTSPDQIVIKFDLSFLDK